MPYDENTTPNSVNTMPVSANALSLLTDLATADPYKAAGLGSGCNPSSTCSSPSICGPRKESTFQSASAHTTPLHSIQEHHQHAGVHRSSNPTASSQTAAAACTAQQALHAQRSAPYSKTQTAAEPDPVLRLAGCCLSHSASNQAACSSRQFVQFDRSGGKPLSTQHANLPLHCPSQGKLPCLKAPQSSQPSTYQQPDSRDRHALHALQAEAAQLSRLQQLAGQLSPNCKLDCSTAKRHTLPSNSTPAVEPDPKPLYCQALIQSPESAVCSSLQPTWTPALRALNTTSAVRTERQADIAPDRKHGHYAQFVCAPAARGSCASMQCRSSQQLRTAAASDLNGVQNDASSTSSSSPVAAQTHEHAVLKPSYATDREHVAVPVAASNATHSHTRQAHSATYRKAADNLSAGSDVTQSQTRRTSHGRCRKAEGSLLTPSDNTHSQTRQTSSATHVDSPVMASDASHSQTRHSSNAMRGSRATGYLLQTRASSNPDMKQSEDSIADSEAEWHVIGEFCSRTLSKCWLRQSLRLWQTAAKMQVKWRSISQVHTVCSIALIIQ